MKSIYIKILVLLCTTSIFAFSPSYSIVVQMAQHDTDSESLRESTFILENGVLNILFDAGHIVSSLPTTINNTSEKSLEESVKLAKDGFMSYVVYVDVNYVPHGFSGDETITLDDIESIDWKVIQTSNMDILREGDIDIVKKNVGESDLNAMKRFSNELGVEIKSYFDKKNEGN